MSRKRSIQAALASALIGAALLVSPGSALAGYGDPGELLTSYAFKCMDDPGNSMDDGTIIDIYECQGADNEDWKVETAPNGALWIVNMQSYKCLTVKGASKEAGAFIVQWACNTNKNETWNIGPSGATTIKNDNSNLCVTVKGNLTANKTPLIQYSCTTTVPNKDWNWIPPDWS